MKSETEIRAKIAEYQAEAQHWMRRADDYKQQDNREMVDFCTAIYDCIKGKIAAFNWILDDPEGETVNDVGRKSD